MSSKTVIVKNRFLDKENDNQPRNPKDIIRVSPERAKTLIELGFAEASNSEEAEEIKNMEPVTVGVTTAPQWIEEKKTPKKAAKKK